MLGERGAPESTARFACALALARPGEILFEARGTIEGRITAPPRGRGGFGYDPIFYYPPFGCTLAEVPAERKSSVSHRGQAFRRLRAYLQAQGLSQEAQGSGLKAQGSGPEAQGSGLRTQD